MRKALIFGTGQDSSYLSELLINKNYKVVVVKRRSSSASTWRFNSVIDNQNFSIVEGDVTDFSSCLNIIESTQPNEIYNLAAQSNVGTSFNQPIYTWNVCAQGVLNILEAMKFLKSKAKLYQASSSEMFGKAFSFWGMDDEDNPLQYSSKQLLKTKFRAKPYGKLLGDFQNEETLFEPQSPYAIAKLAAHNAVNLYRQAYGIYAVGGILFNHESPRRGLGFVTRKITSWFYNNINPFNSNYIYSNKKLYLGNLDAYRDWGYAREYVEAMWLMLQQPSPKDYVIGTGETHSVKDFLIEVMNYYNINVPVSDFVHIDDNLKRAAEVPYLRADASLAEKELGWKPQTSFKELVKLMVEKENGLA